MVPSERLVRRTRFQPALLQVPVLSVPGGVMVTADTTFTVTALSRMAMEAMSTSPAAGFVVGMPIELTPLTVWVADERRPGARVNAFWVVVVSMASLKFRTMFEATATLVAPLAGVVLVTVGLMVSVVVKLKL